MNKNIEIISLIYKSTAYLDFIIDQITRYAETPGWNVAARIVGNNPTAEVAERARASGFRYSEYRDANPDHYFLDFVYRAWNWCVSTSDFDNVVLINSDMGLSPGWLSNLLKHHDGVNIPCSRLVESGRQVSAEPHTLSVNFGRHPREYREKEFLEYAASISVDQTHPGGTYMPVVFNRQRFLEAGGYPEGNLYRDTNEPTGYKIGWKDNKNTPPNAISGDWYFMNDILGKKFGMKHITVFNSCVQHFQGGEMFE